MKHLTACVFWFALLPATAAVGQSTVPRTPGGNELERWVQHTTALLPRSASGYNQPVAPELQKGAAAIDGWGAHLARFEAAATPDSILRSIERLLASKQQIDRSLDQTLELRAQFLEISPAEQRRAAIRNYLAVDSALIDLSGRMRAVLSEAITSAAFRFASQQALRERLIDLLIEHRSSIGADVMAPALFDPPANSPNGALPATPEVKQKLLKLIAVTGQFDLLPRVADFARSLQTTPPLVVAAAETIREIGLPQDERPGSDETLPKPPITARALHELLEKIPDRQLPGDWRSRRDELLAWLAERSKQGLTEARYQLGTFELQPGDWLLMRNPSPYNLFTDLSPGLFTHVGVVAEEMGSDGLRRMVIVDLPERGTVMPATNVEVFLQRTLHYVFLRHRDTAVARAMGEAAASVIGNPTEFDLNFRTGRVAELKGKPLAGQKICTYCAGLLWLCAQESGLPRDEFFPLEEGVAGGKTAENLSKLGMSIGQDFISPTGALFSHNLAIVGRREPMYDPRREVEEAIFDHFAKGMEQKSVSVSPDLYQSLRMKLAEASKGNPLLKQAIAQAAGVSAELDLVAAARGAAVVEMLDEVAYGNSGDYMLAYGMLTYPGPISELTKDASAAERKQLETLAQRHRDLAERLRRERMTPRQLRQILVKYYIDRGTAAIDERFFRPAATTRSRTAR